MLRRLFYVVQRGVTCEIKVSAVLRYVEVCLGLLESGMSEEFLEVVNASAVLKIPGCEGMTEQVRVESFDSAFFLELTEHIFKRVPGERLTFSGLKESPGESHGVKVRLDVFKGGNSKGNGALLASFSGDDKIAFREVKVCDLGGHDLIQTQPCVEHKGEYHAVT